MKFPILAIGRRVGGDEDIRMAVGAQSQLGWLEKRLQGGGEATRTLYAHSRRLWMGRELARRRRMVPGAASSIVLPEEHGHLVPSDNGFWTIIIVATSSSNSFGCQLFDPVHGPVTQVNIIEYAGCGRRRVR